MRRFWRCHIAVLVAAAISVHVLPAAPLAQATSVPTIPQRQGLLMSRYVLVATSNNELDDLEDELQAKGVVILHRQDDSAEATVLATQEQIAALADDRRVRSVEPDASATTEILDATHDDVIDGQYLVTLRPNASSPAQEKILNSLGAGVLYMFSQAIKGFAAELSLSQVSALRWNPNVLAVEKDRVLAITESQSGATWGLDRINQVALPLDGVFSYQASGSDVTAYVIDTGVQASHPNFGGRVQAGYGQYAQTDCHGHGTHVAGTVGSSTYGVAKSVEIVPIQVMDCSGLGWESEIIAGMDWVVSDHLAGVKAVANMSLGGGYSSALNAAVQRMVDDGIVVVVAAGNDTVNACSVSPASAPAAITVGASTSSDYRAYFSNYGSCLDIFAPGQSITSTVMGSSFATWNGTSMASPHVAGAAAILWSLHPEWTASEVSSSLIAAAIPNTVQNAGSGSPTSLLYVSPSATAPTAPTINSVTGSNERLTVAFTAPSSDGGATITNYEYSTDNGSTWEAFSPATTSTPLVITMRSDIRFAVVNGVTYQVMIRAVNSAGRSVASAAMAGKPFTVAGAPTINSVTGSDERLTVAFTAPVSNGGATITNYEYSTDNSSTWKAFSPATTSTPLEITVHSETTDPLVNGTTYQVMVRAVNSAGGGVASAVMAGVPFTVAGAPTINSVTGSDERLTVAFTAPSSDGGATITNYEYSTDSGSTWKAFSPGTTSTPLVLTVRSETTDALVNGTSYEVLVRAVNSAGGGVASAVMAGKPFTVAGAPTINSVTGGSARLTVAFTAPSSDGGATITNYEYSTDNGSTWKVFSPVTTSTPLLITQRSDTTGALVNGTTYQVMVRAVNSAGRSAASAVMSGKPFTVAGAPTINSVTASAARLTVAFTAPVSNGGATITNYEYSTNNGSTWKAFTPADTRTPLVITKRSDANKNLVKGTTYQVRVRAVNAAGRGVASTLRRIMAR